jgi:hypothetical protein
MDVDLRLEDLMALAAARIASGHSTTLANALDWAARRVYELERNEHGDVELKRYRLVRLESGAFEVQRKHR